jgi:hypothetical protein
MLRAGQQHWRLLLTQGRHGELQAPHHGDVCVGGHDVDDDEGDDHHVQHVQEPLEQRQRAALEGEQRRGPLLVLRAGRR